MKKLFLTLVFLFLIYFALQAVFYYFGPGHAVEYSISDFKIKEEYINNQKNEIQSYSFVISNNENTINLQVFKDYNNEQKIIKEIKSIQSNGMLCIMPIFINDESLTDLMCLKDGIIYNYASLKNSSSEIDEFYDALDKYIAKENLESQDTRSNIVLYQSNMQPNSYLSIETYKGFVYANSTKKLLYSKNIFTSDVYDRYLSAYVNEFYVTVNYDEQYGYSKVYIYNIKTGDEKIITLASNIERNSYIQGIYEDSIYLFDRSNKKQYEINTATQNVLEIGNITKGVKVYQHGVFERVSAYECSNNDIFFENDGEDINDYHYLKSTIGNKTGYTYYYKNNGSTYRIYRVNNSNKEQFTYLFEIKQIDKLLAVNEYIFYIYGNYLKYYSDKTGIRTLAFNSELEFNQNINYQIIY